MDIKKELESLDKEAEKNITAFFDLLNEWDIKNIDKKSRKQAKG